MQSSSFSIIAIFVFFQLSVVAVFAQPVSEKKESIIKVNVPALAFKNISLQYERKVNKKQSFALSVRYRPTGSLPFQSLVKKAVDDTLIRIDLTRIGNLGITPEYRFYLSKKGAMQGFYLAPFVSFNHYSGNVPVNYYDYVNNVIIDKTATFSGSVNTYTAGLQLGAQWQLSNKFSLDWWIIGPNYGTSNGTFNFAGSLNDIEQISLQFELEKIKQTIPMIKIDIPKGNPNDNGAVFNVKGPWAGIRAMGLNLGYRF